MNQDSQELHPLIDHPSHLDNSYHHTLVASYKIVYITPALSTTIHNRFFKTEDPLNLFTTHKFLILLEYPTTTSNISPQRPSDVVIDSSSAPVLTKPNTTTTTTTTKLILTTAFFILLTSIFLTTRPHPLRLINLIPSFSTIRTTTSTTTNPTTIPMSTPKSTLKFTPRPSEARGGANHGWLKTFHTFSFADYQGSGFESYGALRVINEDRVIPTQGFGTHAHREFEIFSYILDGQLTHRDSLSNTEILKRGDLQMTSTGTGIRHSEFNDHKTQGVHFLQIWAMPNQRGLKPNYYTRHFSDEEKRGKLVHVVGPLGAEGVEDEREAKGAAPVHSWLGMWASLLPPHQEVTHRISSAFNPALSTGTHVKKVYIHLVQSSGYNTKASYTHADAAKVEVTDGAGGVVVLGEGDGVFVDGGKEGDVVHVKSVGGREAEFVLFEMD